MPCDSSEKDGDVTSASDAEQQADDTKIRDWVQWWTIYQVKPGRLHATVIVCERFSYTKKN